MSDLNRFSDFAEEDKPLEGEKIRIDDILNQEITVKNFEVKDSKFEGKDKYTKVQIEINEKTKVIFTGSKVIADQCKKYKEKIPFIATIKKINNYYTFT